MENLMEPFNPKLIDEIRKVLQSNNVMYLATAVDGNPSVSSVFYGFDETSPGEFELYFFSFLPTVKCTQINYNQNVEIQISESLEKGIKGIQITGRAEVIKDQNEIKNKIKPKINNASNNAFADYYNLPVARWIRIK
ncbi:MAG: pyridoxamine 5'-phosphate oxidase family protein, partial [Candidatus Hodarchaeales archaeon]